MKPSALKLLDEAVRYKTIGLDDIAVARTAELLNIIARYRRVRPEQKLRLAEQAVKHMGRRIEQAGGLPEEAGITLETLLQEPTPGPFTVPVKADF